jgi:hypothetical protein
MNTIYIIIGLAMGSPVVYGVAKIFYTVFSGNLPDYWMSTM